MYQPIGTLPGGSVHRTSVELYQRHVDQGDGRCAACGLPTPCSARRHAAVVIRAAGEDPRWHDERLPAGQRPAPGALQATGEAVQPPATASSWRPAPLPAPLPPEPATESWAPHKPSAARHPSIGDPGISGYAVGGHGRRADVPYIEYER